MCRAELRLMWLVCWVELQWFEIDFMILFFFLLCLWKCHVIEFCLIVFFSEKRWRVMF